MKKDRFCVNKNLLLLFIFACLFIIGFIALKSPISYKSKAAGIVVPTNVTSPTPSDSFNAFYDSKNNIITINIPYGKTIDISFNNNTERLTITNYGLTTTRPICQKYDLKQPCYGDDSQFTYKNYSTYTINTKNIFNISTKYNSINKEYITFNNYLACNDYYCSTKSVYFGSYLDLRLFLPDVLANVSTKNLTINLPLYYNNVPAIGSGYVITDYKKTLTFPPIVRPCEEYGCKPKVGEKCIVMDNKYGTGSLWSYDTYGQLDVKYKGYEGTNNAYNVTFNNDILIPEKYKNSYRMSPNNQNYLGVSGYSCIYYSEAIWSSKKL